MVNDGKGRLKYLFAVLQKQMLTELQLTRGALEHPGTKGDNTEIKWNNWLSKYLPNRYSIDKKAFVIDATGNLSQQIDLVIYDNQYTPFIFVDEDVKYVPAESVYAVFEIKQSLDKAHIEYAVDKIESVKNLVRTSAPIVHAGGQYTPVSPKKIISGILTLSSDWTQNLEKHLVQNIKPDSLDLICSLECGSFMMDYNNGVTVESSSPQESLIYFFLKLMQELQKIGTVAAIDITEYAKNLECF